MKSKKAKTILVIFNERYVKIDHFIALEKAGYHIILAPNGLQAILRFNEVQDIDFIITDVQLPGYLNGVETVETILRYRDIPVLFRATKNDADLFDRIKAIASCGMINIQADNRVIISSIKLIMQSFGLRNLKEKEVNLDDDVVTGTKNKAYSFPFITNSIKTESLIKNYENNMMMTPKQVVHQNRHICLN